jgi:predicted exporter
MAVAPIYRKLGNRKLQYSALIAIAITCIVTIVLLPSNDSILNLNTSTPALLDAEKRVQTIFSQTSSSQFFLVSANTENELLSNLSTLTEILRQKNVSASNSLEKFIPRQSIQLDSQHLVQQQLQGDDGALSQLCELLSFDCNIFTEFNAPQSQTLTITKALREIPNIIPPTINSDGKWYSIKSIHPQSDINYQAIAKQVTGTEFINRTQRTSDLLGRYRLTVSVVLVLTLAVLSLGFYLRYRQDCIKILLPLFTALLLTTAIANLQGLTLFHLMALLLVMGIGIDTAIFYQEVGIDGDSWLAASLSSLTSVLAFGLLSLSAVPILHQFGQVVLVGIVFCWLLTPLFFIKNKPYKGIDS